MEERGISEEEIECAVRNPAVEIPGKQPGTKIAYVYTRDERRLGVVFKPKGKRILIITADWS